jgi:hypothetical protein
MINFLQVREKGSAPKFPAKALVQFCFVCLFLSCAACADRRDEPKDPIGYGSIVGANYTRHAIQSFAVDGAWGGNVHPYSGGGSYVCCARYPKQWSPTFEVLVQWRRSDGRGADGAWRIKSIEQKVTVEKYMDEGNVYVLFLPDDKVKVFVSDLGVGNPRFPSKPGYPEDAKKDVP